MYALWKKDEPYLIPTQAQQPAAQAEQQSQQGEPISGNFEPEPLFPVSGKERDQTTTKKVAPPEAGLHKMSIRRTCRRQFSFRYTKDNQKSEKILDF